MTALDKRDPRLELANCQRFYNISTWLSGGYHVAGGNVDVAAYFPTAMRAAPTIVIGSTSNTNLGTVTAPFVGSTYAGATAQVTATGGYSLLTSFTASADL
jgi:hypothetical protein